MSRMTKVYLCKVPIENDYKHTYFFKSRDEQYNCFYGLRKKDLCFEDLSYQRKDEYIRVPAHFDEVSKCNYVMYKNPNYSYWRYAFITDVKYMDEGRTDVYIETDVLQNYFFDYDVFESFIDREHADKDSEPNITPEENFELGEHMINSYAFTDELKGCYAIVASNFNPDTNLRFSTVRIHEGMITGTKWYAFDLSGEDENGDLSSGFIERIETELSAMATFIRDATKDGQAESIQSIFAVPKAIINPQNINADRSLKNTIYDYPYGSTFAYELSRPTSVSGYTPRNAKLLQYPYSYILVSNNSGASNIYRYEDFYYFDGDSSSNAIGATDISSMNTTSKCRFIIRGVPSEGCSIKLIPMQYKGKTGENNEYDDEGFMCGKYPTFSWSTDAYTNWLAQNSANMSIDAGMAGAQAAAGAIGSLISMDFGGAVRSALSPADTLINQIKAKNTASFSPNIAKGNVTGGDINFASGRNGFHFYQMGIKPEIARTIDDYFTMYGYKTNRLKVPNTGHRSRFWFTKTVEVNLDGDVPQTDLQKIKDCYNRGVTFWVDHANIGRYADENKIVEKEE